MELSDYAKTLSEENRRRYLEKLSLLENVDPYLLRPTQFDTKLNCIPQINERSVLDYLIFRSSPFTMEQIKAYKSMDAYAQVVSKWVREIRVKKMGTNFVFVGKVLHSQRINDSPAKSWVIITEDGTVTAAHCDCVAGLGEVCTHVAAILFVCSQAKAGDERSVTDTLAYWIDKGKKDIHLAVAEIDFSTSKSLWKQCQMVEAFDGKRISVPSKMSRKAVVKFLEKYKSDDCESALFKIVKPFSLESVTSEDQYNLLYSELYSEEYRSLTLEDLQELGSTVKVFLTEEACKTIEKQTRLQSRTPKWFLYRKGRITASMFKAVCRTSPDKPAVSVIKRICYPEKVFCSKQTKYGCDHEKDALELYLKCHQEKHPSAKLVEVGLILHPDYPQFGATPDSLIDCDECGQGCVEVKCPFCIKDTYISELLSVKGSYLLKVGDTIVLDRKHTYFYQVQMQVWLSQKAFCDFVVWTDNDYFCERIYPDEQFWRENSERAVIFFNKVILPELLSKYFTNKVRREESTSPEETLNDRITNTKEIMQCYNKNCKTKYFSRNSYNLSRIPKKWFCNDCKK